MANEDFFFHLSKAELVELELSHEGGLSTSLQKVIDAQDGKTIIAEFKNIILMSYGKRSEDGKRFIKNQALREEFESTEAYSTLFMELVTEPEKAIEFVNGVIPAGLVQEAAAEMAKLENRPPITAVPEPAEPEKDRDVEVVTRKELIEMGPDEFAKIQDRIRLGEVTLAES